MKRINLLLIPVCALAFTLGSCGNVEEENIVTLFEVSVPENREYLMVGEEIKLNVEAYGYKTDKIIYSSNNEKVLSINEEGNIKALAPGSGTITITIDGTEESKKASFTVVENLENRNPELQKMVDSMSNYDYANGVNYFGELRLDAGVAKIGDGLIKISVPVDMTLPIDLKVQTDDDETNVRARFDFDKSTIFDQELTGLANTLPISALLTKTFAEFLCPDFSDYMTLSGSLLDMDATLYKDARYLDIYNLGDLNYYTAINRNFGTEEEPSYRPYAFGENNVTNLLTPVLNLLIGSNGNVENEGDYDFSSILTKDGLLQVFELVWSMVDSKVEENSTTITLLDSTLVALNSMYVASGVGGTKELELNGTIIKDIYLPTLLTDVTMRVENKNEGENKFSLLDLSIKGLNPVGEEYEFLGFTITEPEMLEKDVFVEMRDLVEAYKEASLEFAYNTKDILGITMDEITSAKKMTQRAKALFDMKKNFDSVTENDKIKKEANTLWEIYENKELVNEYRSDLLYPTKYMLEKSGYGSGTEFTKLEINDEEVGEVKPLSRLVNPQKITLTSENPDIIKINDEGNGYQGVSALYNGAVNSNKKGVTNKAAVVATIKHQNGTSKDRVYITYTGANVTFKETKATLNDNSKLDKATHTVSMKIEETFNFSNLISLPEGATESTITYSLGASSTLNCKGITIDKNAGVVTANLDTGIDSGLASVIAKCSYLLNGENITENVIIFIDVSR